MFENSAPGSTPLESREFLTKLKKADMRVKLIFLVLWLAADQRWIQVFNQHDISAWFQLGLHKGGVT
jgi:hypothetical protein